MSGGFTNVQAALYKDIYCCSKTVLYVQGSFALTTDDFDRLQPISTSNRGTYIHLEIYNHKPWSNAFVNYFPTQVCNSGNCQVNKGHEHLIKCPMTIATVTVSLFHTGTVREAHEIKMKSWNIKALVISSNEILRIFQRLYFS